jgi:hypothetical protein
MACQKLTNQDSIIVNSKHAKATVLDKWFNRQIAESIPYYKKQIGFEGEVEAYTEFLDAGLGKYLVKHNPMNSLKDYCADVPQKGCDFVFKIGRTIPKIECSTMGKDYNYKNEYFKESRLPRLFNPEYEHKPKGCRKNPFKIVRIWLVMNADRLRNYYNIKQFAAGFGVLLFTISELISYLLSLITVNTVTTASINYTLNTNSHIVINSNSKYSDYIIQDNNKKRENADLDFDKEIDKAKKLGLFDDYGFSS